MLERRSFCSKYNICAFLCRSRRCILQLKCNILTVLNLINDLSIHIFTILNHQLFSKLLCIRLLWSSSYYFIVSSQTNLNNSLCLTFSFNNIINKLIRTFTSILRTRSYCNNEASASKASRFGTAIGRWTGRPAPRPDRPSG